MIPLIRQAPLPAALPSALAGRAFTVRNDAELLFCPLERALGYPLGLGDLEQIEEKVRSLNYGEVEVWDGFGNRLR